MSNNIRKKENNKLEELNNLKKLNIYRPFEVRKNVALARLPLMEKRNFPVAIKEWKNSSYTFDKNSLKHLPAIDETVTKLIKSYFWLDNTKDKARSRRMRSLRKKYTTNKIFVSKPEIKQTNDKVIVTVYTFNREKRFLLKKLYFHNRRLDFLKFWKDKNRLYSVSLINKNWVNNNNNKQNNWSFNEKVKAKVISFIRQHKSMYPVFASKIAPKKEKRKLYIKLFNKMARSMYYSKLVKMEFSQTIKKNSKSKELYFYTTDSKINSYKNKIKRRFRKTVKPIQKSRYTRKKMKGLDLTKRRVTKGLIRQNRKRVGKRIIPYNGMKLKNEMNFFSFRLLLNNKKYGYVRKLFYYYFLKYTLSMFNIKIFAFKGSIKPSNKRIKDILDWDALSSVEKLIKKDRKGKRRKKSKFVYPITKKLASLYKAPLSLTSEGTNVKIYFYTIKKNIKLLTKMKNIKTNVGIYKYITNTKPIIINLNLSKNENKLDNLDYILSNVNFIVSQFLNKVLINSGISEKDRKLNNMYQRFSKIYYTKFVSKLWDNDIIFSSYYLKLMLNKFKFNKLLPHLKVLISKIYNKNTELNIINLKYFHLNTDIFTSIVALKLRKKKTLLAVLKKALSMAKRPVGYKDRSSLDIDMDLNKLNSLRVYGSLKLINLNKKCKIYSLSLQDILKKVYPRSLVNKVKSTWDISYKESKLRIAPGKVKNILNTIKYKTVSGVKLRGSGRLSKRFAASRSVVKQRHAGNFQDKDFSRIVQYQNKSQPAIRLRNYAKGNSQYSVTSSKRRTGAFGIKGWISGY